MKQVIDADLVVLKKKRFFFIRYSLQDILNNENAIFIVYNEKKINAPDEFHTVCISPCRIDLRMLYGIMHGIGTDVNLNLLIRFHNYIIIFFIDFVLFYRVHYALRPYLSEI